MGDPDFETCPCGTGADYAACCRPLHRGEREAEDASVLMRSRYAAFVRKEVSYLWRTLHSDHDDRARPEAEVLRELREACSSNRYRGLHVLDKSPADRDGIARVLFAAKVFRKGRDVSFVELSEFAAEASGAGVGNAWRYLRGDGRSVAASAAAAAMTIEAFLASAGAS
jgi:SEC-C motif-containing protein